MEKKNYWLGKSKKECDEALDKACIDMYGVKHKDLSPCMPEWSKEKLRAYQDMTRKYN
jgi:hypothetical protein